MTQVQTHWRRKTTGTMAHRSDGAGPVMVKDRSELTAAIIAYDILNGVPGWEVSINPVREFHRADGWQVVEIDPILGQWQLWFHGKPAYKTIYTDPDKARKRAEARLGNTPRYRGKKAEKLRRMPDVRMHKDLHARLTTLMDRHNITYARLVRLALTYACDMDESGRLNLVDGMQVLEGDE